MASSRSTSRFLRPLFMQPRRRPAPFEHGWLNLTPRW
jgi:hypothetical protein